MFKFIRDMLRGSADRKSSSGFDIYEARVQKTGRSRWEWFLYDGAGHLVMQGIERRRSAAIYAKNRALFLLLSNRRISR
ncbi:MULTISPECIES: hypothetical protein [unclassified Bradyrhizobium]|uniref:hypothetical protein n=1 Tax=unclassified Bradyrhizobium TaxID=2631580 RepID=UPI0015C795ED|nr:MULTISPECIES: hypothetical protein [unclassified Bradyrhizobium]MBB4260536.1 hypothetical protein [Bradyrhizobium sp. CIR3A]NYG46806.1 hypothetical protein [Bradyrhizobium sp. IAR9]